MNILNIEQEFLEIVNKLTAVVNNQSLIDFKSKINNVINYGVIVSSGGNVKTTNSKYTFDILKNKSHFNSQLVVDENEKYKYTIHIHYLNLNEKPVCMSRLEQIYSFKEQRVIYSTLISDTYDAANLEAAIKNEN